MLNALLGKPHTDAALGSLSPSPCSVGSEEEVGVLCACVYMCVHVCACVCTYVCICLHAADAANYKCMCMRT